MTYRVVWLDQVTDQLATIYLEVTSQHGDTHRLNDALNRVEAGLASNPGAFGESRSGTARVWFEGPVEVLYEVHEDEGVVVVRSIQHRPNR
jgi:hypothetical protein